MVSVSDGIATLQTRGLPANGQYAVSVLCRGVLKHFAPVTVADGTPVNIPLPMDSLPVGVNDLTVFDSEGRILADRLFFKGMGQWGQWDL